MEKPGLTPSRARGNENHMGARFVAGAQVRSDALAALRRSGDIGDRHLAAAERWCVDWTMGVEGARHPLRPTSGQAGDRDIGMLSRIKASARCEKVRLALGASAELRLRMTIIDELSFCEIGRRLMPGDINGRKKIAAQTALLLEMLAEHYQSSDRHTSQQQRSVQYGKVTFC